MIVHAHTAPPPHQEGVSAILHAIGFLPPPRISRAHPKSSTMHQVSVVPVQVNYKGNHAHGTKTRGKTYLSSSITLDLITFIQHLKNILKIMKNTNNILLLYVITYNFFNKENDFASNCLVMDSILEHHLMIAILSNTFTQCCLSFCFFFVFFTLNSL